MLPPALKVLALLSFALETASSQAATAKAIRYSCEHGHYWFTATFAGAHAERVSVTDSAGHKYNLQLTNEKRVRKYTNERGSILFVLESRHSASLNIVDNLHLHCAPAAPAR